MPAAAAPYAPPFSRKPPSSTFAVILSTIAACLVSGGITYLATNPDDPEPLVPVATAAPTHTALNADGEARTVALEESEPITFPNPFDATEIFSFPPGTTPLEMREAVSKILLERARERGFGSHGARRGG